MSNFNNLDAIHDTVSYIHERSEVNDEMARDEARHGKAFEGLLARYFG
jgi:hypothetical protein